jgi:hypothetical protein
VPDLLGEDGAADEPEPDVEQTAQPTGNAVTKDESRWASYMGSDLTGEAQRAKDDYNEAKFYGDR